MQEAYYKWYTFTSAQNAMREAVQKAKMLRMERYSVASIVRAAAADVLSQAPKPVRTPTPKRPARKVWLWRVVVLRVMARSSRSSRRG